MDTLVCTGCGKVYELPDGCKREGKAQCTHCSTIIYFGPDKNFQDLFLKSRLGPKVLGELLDQCHFGEPSLSDEWQAVQNFMKVILSRCGIGFVGEGEKFVRALMTKKVETVE